MRRRVFSVFVPAIALAVAVVAAAASGNAGSVAANAGLSRPFVVYDAIGEATSVADITSVAVARDAQDRLTFAINVANHPSIKRGEVFKVGIDADRRLATGSNGFDVVLALVWPAGDKRPWYTVGSWDGSEWQELDVAADVAYPDHGPRFTVAGSDIGVGRSFRFAARAERVAATTTGAPDRAPGTGFASVTLSTPAEVAEIDRATIPMPALMPEAGKILKVKGIELTIAEDQTEIAPGISVRSMVRPDKTRCTAKVGQTKLKTVSECTWRIPRTARGKRLVLQVTIAYRGDEWTSVYPLDIE